MTLPSRILPSHSRAHASASTRLKNCTVAHEVLPSQFRLSISPHSHRQRCSLSGLVPLERFFTSSMLVPAKGRCPNDITSAPTIGANTRPPPRKIPTRRPRRGENRGQVGRCRTPTSRPWPSPPSLLPHLA
eukprot:scaffold692_cov78-Phaeocystis_antarctica.AAC.4